MYDVEIQDHGSIHMIMPLTDAVENWIRDNVIDPIWYGGGIAVEPRYTIDILLGMQEDGFNVPLEKKN